MTKATYSVYRLLVFLLAGLISAACTVTPEPAAVYPGIKIQGLRVLNQTFSPVTGFTMLVINTGEFISCTNIAVRGICATRFPLREYQGNEIDIRWRQGASEWSTGKFVVEPEDHIDPLKPAMVTVMITGSGLAITQLTQ